MSEASTPVTAEHFSYLAERTTQEDTFLQALKSDARLQGIPPIWISPEQGSFIQILLMSVGAKEVVEIGTLAGYSAVWMARALPPDGRVRTIEASPRYAAFAEKKISQSDVSRKIEIHRGKAAEILPAFRDDSADAVFIDADKDGYPAYLKESMRIVRRGGLILADNAFGFGHLFDPSDPGAESIRTFNEIMAREKSLRSIIVPIGDGLWFGLKID